MNPVLSPELAANPRIHTVPPQDILQHEAAFAAHAAIQLAKLPSPAKATRTRIWQREPTLDAGLFILACVFNKSQGSRGEYDLRQIAYHMNAFFEPELSKPEYCLELGLNRMTTDLVSSRLKLYRAAEIAFIDLSHYDQRPEIREYYRPPHARTAEYLLRIRNQRQTP